MSIPKAEGKQTINEDEIEIRLSDIVQFLKDSRRKIVIGSIIGFIVGALYAFNKPNMYSAQVTVMPEHQSKSGNLGGLGSLAGLAGIDIGGMSGGSIDAIRPDLYPNVLQSVPFALALLKQPVYSQKLQAKMSLQEFMERVDESSIVGKVSGMFSSDDEEKESAEEDKNLKKFSQAIHITKKQDLLIKGVQNAASATYDKKTGILSITASEPDPIVAATVTRLSLEYLTNYIITYRTEKARKQVSFLIQQVDEAKKRYQISEFSLSAYRDRNRGTFLNTAKIDEQRLQADYLLAQSVYNDLSKQLEQAKIKVQEETPVFKILEPPTVPVRKSGPKRTLIVVGFMLAGIVTVLIISLGKRII